MKGKGAQQKGEESAPVPTSQKSVKTYGRRLGRDVVRDAIDARDLVGDARRDTAEDVGREDEPIGGHKVLRLHGSERDHLLVCPPIAHNAHGTHGQQHRERLADALVQARRADLLEVDRVCLLQQLHLRARHGPQDPNREAGAWEGVTLHERRRDGK